MTKYDEAFKLRVVQNYAEGQNGLSRLANQYGFDRTTISRWVKSYEHRLRQKFSRYSAPFTLSVLQRIWQAERSNARCAKRWGY